MRSNFLKRLELASGKCLIPGMDDQEGMFALPFRGVLLKIIASHGMDWDHVSVSLPNRCPNWEEMTFVKDIFFDDEETVMQLHPPKSKYVNNHAHCLHLWRPQAENIPLPPEICVGIKDMGVIDTKAKEEIARGLFFSLNRGANEH